MTIYDKIPEIKASLVLTPRKDILSKVKSVTTTFLYTKVSTNSETREVKNDSKPKVKILKGNVINFTIGSRTVEKTARSAPAIKKFTNPPVIVRPENNKETKKSDKAFVATLFNNSLIN